MSARKKNTKDNSNSSDIIPFSKIKDNKALNQFLYYVDNDDFALMINESSMSK